MGQGCSADQQPNGGNIERKSKDMGSPVFIGMYGGGNQGSGGPQSHCPPAPNTVPTPPCGGRTNNCEAKGEAQRLADRPETVTCDVTEYELTCKWEPKIVKKSCTVMVPQYKAVCAEKDKQRPGPGYGPSGGYGQSGGDYGNNTGNKKMMATVKQTFEVDSRFDANNDGVIQQNEYEAARAAGGLTAMGGPTIMGGGGAMGGGAMGGGAMSGGAGFGGAQMGGAAGGAQMMGGAQMGGLQMGGAQMGGAQMGGAQMMGGGMSGAMGGAQMGGFAGGNMGGGGGYGN